MTRPLLKSYPENATTEELKAVIRMGSNETGIHCTAIQMLLAGASRKPLCNALLVTNRALRKWISRFSGTFAAQVIKSFDPERCTQTNLTHSCNMEVANVK
jgi:hypothetical protein